MYSDEPVMSALSRLSLLIMCIIGNAGVGETEPLDFTPQTSPYVPVCIIASEGVNMFFIMFIEDEQVHAARASIIEGTSGMVIYITTERFISSRARDFTDTVTHGTFKY